MKSALIDPNTSLEIISNEKLIKEFKNPKRYNRPILYALMAKRSNNNETIMRLLFEVIIDKKIRKEYFLNTIIHALLPVLFVLEQGEDKIKQEQKDLLLDKWTEEEYLMLIDYIKTNEEYYNLLKKIAN